MLENGYNLELENGYNIELECNVAPKVCSWLLLESGYNILLEDGYNLELECQEVTVGSFVLSMSGPWAASHNVTVTYQAIGNQVTLSFPLTSYATTSAATIVSAAGIPSALYPNATWNASGIPCLNDTTDSDGSISISGSTGVVTIGLNVVGTGELIEFNDFENAGNAGWNAFTVTYLT